MNRLQLLASSGLDHLPDSRDLPAIVRRQHYSERVCIGDDVKLGGAHRNRIAAMDSAGVAISGALDALDGMPADLLRQRRRDRFRAFASGPAQRAA